MFENPANLTNTTHVTISNWKDRRDPCGMTTSSGHSCCLRWGVTAPSWRAAYVGHQAGAHRHQAAPSYALASLPGTEPGHHLGTWDPWHGHNMNTNTMHHASCINFNINTDKDTLGYTSTGPTHRSAVFWLLIFCDVKSWWLKIVLCRCWHTQKLAKLES